MHQTKNPTPYMVHSTWYSYVCSFINTFHQFKQAWDFENTLLVITRLRPALLAATAVRAMTTHSFQNLL